MAEATPSRHRPEFRNIHVSDIAKYRLPLAGRLSILHRVTGLLLFLALPLVLLPLFEKSLTSEISFDAYREIASGVIVKLILLVLAWAYLHHMCAGVRYLLLDLHMGIDKDGARKSAGAVFAVSIALTLCVALKIFGVF